MDSGDDANRRPAGSRRPILLAISIAVAVISVAWFALRWAYPFGPAILGWLPVPAGPIAGFVAARRVARAPGLSLPARRFWQQVAVAAVLLSVMVCTAAYDSLAGPGAPRQQFGPVSLGLGALALTTLLWSLLRLPVRHRSRTEWLTVSLDIAIVAVAAGLMLWYFITDHSTGRRPVTDDTAAVMSVVVLTTVTVLAALKMSLTGATGIDRRSGWALGGTVVAGAMLGAHGTLLAERPDLSVLMPVMPLVYLGIVTAARLQLRAATTDRRQERPRKRTFNLLPYAAVAGTDAVLLLEMRHSSDNLELMIVGSVTLTVLVVVRQLFAFADNARLLARVDASMLELRRHEQRFRSLVQNSYDVITIIGTGGRFTYLSPGARRVLGIEPAEWTGRLANDSVHPDDLPALDALVRALHGEPGASVRAQARVFHADGAWRWMEVTYTNLLDDPSVNGIVCNARDISDTRRYQDQLAYQASHDELTGLANRALFASRTERAVATAEPGTVAVALVDLDDFKTINDRLGHAVGDALLVAVSARLRACMRPDDTVARLGGDEFAVLLTDLRPGESGTIAERIIAALTESVSAGTHDLLIQASIGLADNDTGSDADDLLRRADIAMYAAKELGKNRYVNYDSDLDARAVEHAQLAAELSHALERDELRLLYQPVVDLPTGKLVGVEALVRWMHSRDGMVSPVRFIPVAERTGLIVPLGEWILRTACRQAAEWHRQYGDEAPEKMSVNVSARQLLEPAFPQTVAAILTETGLEPGRLTIEITETAVFGGGRAVEAVAAIHALGVAIALDDFGTGHSSLGLLRTCPVDVLKVDKSFVDGVTGTVEQEAIVTSIIEIAQALGLRAIAEGVETGAQADRLHTLGYRMAQGFHFAKPLDPTEVERMFTARDGYAPAAA
ncbi:putative bifunctional diguanylate cyclase/phosphodiesterase [Planosporangium sp. 12N6]|uniref:putative bifunctional diguanylate cyclase/phosphodiesterase n=1 Tax=Planosporangium spinosum TaxID=3402278 RepID=UPI003CF8D632